MDSKDDVSEAKLLELTIFRATRDGDELALEILVVYDGDSKHITRSLKDLSRIRADLIASGKGSLFLKLFIFHFFYIRNYTFISFPLIFEYTH